MIVKRLGLDFNPVPKPKDIKNSKRSQRDSKRTKEKDFCIMPNSILYSTIRTATYCERHEVFFSKAYRQKSIDDGLIVFLTRQAHRGTNGVHGKNGDTLNRKLKRIAQKAYMDYYKKSKEDFIQRYGKNYL